jgi:amidase
VPSHPARLAWSGLAVEGPMARNVADAAALLAVMAGSDPRSPISIPESGAVFAGSLDRDFSGVRLAWSRDFGELPVDSRVTAVLEAQRQTFIDLGCEVEDGEPDFSGAGEIFHVLRAWSFAMGFVGAGADVLGRVKDTIAWNVAQGRALSGDDVGRAARARAKLYHRVREFMQTHEFLLAPVSQVPPFDIRERWVREVAGQKMESYIDWMKSCSYVTLTGHPAISVPAGFTPEGLPVGIQIVGRHRDDLGVLQLAHAFEQATGFHRRRPPQFAS